MMMNDPSNVASRVFVGGVSPECVPDNLSAQFQKHGRVQGVIVLKGFAFVQFSKEEEALKAIAQENGQLFEGKKLVVKQAQLQPVGGPGGGPSRGAAARGRGSRFPGPPRGHFGGGRGGGPSFRPEFDPNYGQRRQYGQGTGSDPIHKNNDCEIVCVSRFQRSYAEMIENRLKSFGLKIDVLFPNPDIPLPKILGNISSRGVRYAIVVTPLNEEHNSMTVNILQGPQPQEHRNMPLEDAMSLLARNFENCDPSLPKEKSLLSGQGDDGIPKDICTVIGFLMEKRPLSVMEYDKLIKFLAQKREGVLREEYGDKIPADLAHPPIGPPVDPAVKAKQNELQERIMAVLNKPRPTPAPSETSSSLNPSLQRAIDNLIRTGPNLLNQMNQQGYAGENYQFSG